MGTTSSSKLCRQLVVTSLIDEDFSTNFTSFDDLASSVISFVSINIDKCYNDTILSFRCYHVKQECANSDLQA